MSVDPELPAVGSMVIADSGAVLGLCIAARERTWVVSPIDAILERCRLKLWQPPEIKAFTLPRENPGVVAEVVAQKADNWGIGEAKSQAMVDDARARASALDLGAPPEDTKELEAAMAMFNPDGSPREDVMFFLDGSLPLQVGAR